MKIDLDNKPLSEEEKAGVQTLLDLQNPAITDDLEQIWYLMDKVWDSMGCDNEHLDWEKISQYYAHPVWLLNGLFIESHDISTSNRKAIAHYIAQKGFKNICDYGGGFGTLAREIAKVCKDSRIYIYEPFPSEYGKKRIAEYDNIEFIDTLPKDTFDCLVSTDVLEHLENPLEVFYHMLESLQIGGQALMGNCFYPVIKCHLPRTFYLRYSFKYIAKGMGLRYDGVIDGAEYVQIYAKNGEIRKASQLASGGGQILYSLMQCLEPLRPFARKIKHFIKSKSTRISR